MADDDETNEGDSLFDDPEAVEDDDLVEEIEDDFEDEEEGAGSDAERYRGG